MQFEDSFFENEVRDGFFVPSEVKRAWAAELEVLSEVDRICRKYDITYYADWGTLLAAVRHKGFIPWDDDLDIAMKRADYNRFMEVANRELPEGFCAYNYKNHDDFWLFLARVVGKPRICFEEDHLKRFHEFPYIAGVDIFVLDYVSSDEEKEDTRCTLARYMIKIADEIADGNLTGKDAEAALKKLENLRGIRIAGPESKKKADMDAFRRRMYEEVEKLFSMFQEDESEMLTQLFPFGLQRRGFYFPKKYYDSAPRIPYENTTIPVPVSYDAALRKRYGNYMRLVRNGGGHDYPFFETQKAQLETVLGEELPHYQFSASELLRDKKEEDKQKAGSFRTMARECCGELLRLHQKLLDGLTGWQENRKDVSSGQMDAMVQELQQFAIDFGTMIEQEKGEDFAAVKYLENYCETLFEIYEDQYENSEKTGMLSTEIREIEASVKRDIEERKEVVLLPYKACAWKTLESAWEAATEDPACDVYVIPIPYYYKNYAGDFLRMRYEADQFPAKVHVTKYDAFDFSYHHPDVIVIQNPYDEYDSALSVHPFFYSGNLRKYTDRLIYIPDFTVAEFSKDNYREYHNMKYYCTVPGVIRADQVIVQSENMRTLYVEKLTEFAGADTRAVWESKIHAADCPNRDTDKTGRVPDAWQQIVRTPDGGRKTIIVYGINACCLVEKGDAMLQKIRDAFAVFKKESDNVTPVFRPHPQLEDFTAAASPELWNQYRQMVKEYRAEGWGIYDEETEDHILAAAADAYYGDGGSLALSFMQAGKPVLESII